jgi:hypothetical protein
MSSQTVVDVTISGTTSTVVDTRVDGVTTVAGAAPITNVTGQIPDIGVVTNYITENITLTSDGFNQLSGGLVSTGQYLTDEIAIVSGIAGGQDLTDLSGNLITTGQYLTDEIAIVSGIAGGQDLTSLSGTVNTLSGNLITTGQTLQVQITSNDGDIQNILTDVYNITNNLITTGQTLTSEIAIVSGLTTGSSSDPALSGKVDTLSGNLITTGQTLLNHVADVNQTLQAQITSNDSDIADLTSNLITTGQTLTSEITIVSGIAENHTDVTALSGKVDDISGNLITTGQTLQAQITSNDVQISTISNNLSTDISNLVTTGQTLTSEIAIVSGIATGGSAEDFAALSGNLITTGQTLQSQITSNAADINTVSSNLISTGSIVDDISGNLITTGQNLSSDISTNVVNIASNVSNISSLSTNLITTGQTLQTQITSNDLDVSDLTSNLVTTGQTLQTQITSNDGDITNLTSNLITTGQTLTSEIAIVSGLTTGSSSDPDLSGKVDTLSGNLITTGQTLTTNINLVSSNLVSTGAVVDDISGNLITTGQTLQTQITSNDSDIATLTSNLITTGSVIDDVSGNLITTGQTLQTQITSNDNDISNITSNLVTTGQTLQTQITSNDSDISALTSNLVTTGQTLTSEIAIVSGLATGGSEQDFRELSGNLITSGQTLTSEIGIVSGLTVTNSNNLVSTGSAVDDISGNLITTGQTLQTQITSNDSDISTLTSNLVTTGQTLTTNINTVSSNLISTGKVVDDISGNLITTGQTLQAQITSNDGDITTLTSNLVTTGQTLTTNINTVATNLGTSGQTLQTQITSNDSDISTLTSNLGTTGQTLQTQITSNDSDIASLTTNLGTTGQTLQTQITSNDSDISTLDSTTVKLTTNQSIAGNKIFTNDVTINNLTVTGTEVVVDVENLAVKDNIIEINSGESGAGISRISGGIVIDRGTAANANILYNDANDRFELNFPLAVEGEVVASASNLITTGQTLTTNINTVSTNLGTSGQTLQTQITSNDGDISTLTTNLGTTGQTLQTQITSNDSDISTLTSNLVTTGQTLTTNINTVSTNLISTGKVVDDISGNLITTGQTLQTQITSNDTDITNLSSNLVTTGQTLTTNINTVANNLVTTGQTLTSEIATVSGLIPATVIDGGGTANKVPLWSDANTIGDSVISQSSSKIGIGTATPSAPLHVAVDGTAEILLERTTGLAGMPSQIKIKSVGSEWSLANNLAGPGRFSIKDVTDNRHVMVFDGDGNVSMGTTTPSFTPGWLASDRTLLIAGAGGGGVFVERTGTTARRWGIGIKTDGSFAVSDDTGSTAPLLISTAGVATFSGAVTANAGINIDNINIDGTTISLSSSNLTLDVAGDIILDSNTANWRFKDNGTAVLEIGRGGGGGGPSFYSAISDADMVFKGNDGGSAITALTLDMSAGGNAIFNDLIKTGNMSISSQEIDVSSGDLTLDAAGIINLDADGAYIYLKDAGTSVGLFKLTSSDFYIKSTVSDKDLIFQGNDGGSTVTALTLDMSEAGAATFNSALTVGGNATFSGVLNLNNGSDNCFRIEADAGKDTYINSYGSGNFIQFKQNSAAVLSLYETFLAIPDSTQLRFGGGSDLRFYHDGNNSYIWQVGVGALNIKSSVTDGNIVFTADRGDGGGTFDYFSVNGGDTTYAGGVTTAYTKWPDNSRIALGGGKDLQLYHDGSNSHIKNTGSLYVASETSGDLYLRSDDDIFIQPQGGENGITLTGNGAVTLYYDNAIKLATNSGGVTVTGTAILGGASFVDNATAYFGTGNDLRIYHDGNHSYIKDAGTGSLVLATSRLSINNAASNEEMISAIQNGAVELFYANSKKLETTSTGVTVTGAGTFSTSLKAATILDASNSAGTSGQILTSTGSALDWKTLGEISGVDGSGTANYLSKWTDTDTIGNSTIYDDGKVSIASPTASASTYGARLNVEESAAWSQGIALYINNSATYNNSKPTAFLGVANSSANVFLSAGARVVGDPASANWGKTSNSTTAAFYRQLNAAHIWYTNTSLTADTAYTPTERMRIAADGNVGIGTIAPSADLEVSTASGGELLVTRSGNSGVTLQQVNGGAATSGSLAIKAGTAISFSTNGTNQGLYINNQTYPRVGIGTNSFRSIGGLNPQLLNIEGVNSQWDSGLTIVSNATGDYEAACLVLGRTGGTTAGSNTIVTDNDVLGRIIFTAADGVDMRVTPAEIRSSVDDSSPAADSIKGNLEFYTNDGSSVAPTVRFSIAPAGAVTFNSAFTFPTADGSAGQVLQTNGSGTVTWSTVTGGGGVSGSGTDNYIPRWNGTTALQNSAIFSDDNDNVGIGTAAPGSNTPLHIYTNSASDQTILLDNDGSGRSGLKLRADRNSDGNSTGFIIFDALNDASQDTRYATIESFIVDNTDGTEDGALRFSVMAAGTDTESMTISARSGISDIGFVGIGTNAPAFPLQVYGANQTNGSAKRIVAFLDTTSAAAGTGAGIALGGYTNGTGGAINDFGVIQGIKENGTADNYASALTFHTRANGANTTEQMRINSAGNVGVGTVAPAAHLHVSKAVGATTVLTQVAANSTVGYEIKKTGSTTQHWKIVDGQTANGYLEIYDATDSATRMAFNTNGNVGIGTVNAPHLLTLKGDNKYFASYASDGSIAVQLGADSSGDGNFILFDHSGGTKVKLYAESGGANYINNGGNFGIGTTAPATPLHVYSTANDVLKIQGADHVRVLIDGTDSSEKSLNFSEAGSLMWKLGMENIAPLEAFVIKNNDNGAPQFVIDYTTGYVGIGVDPDGIGFRAEQSVNGNWAGLIKNTHATNGHGLKVQAGDDSAVTSFRVADVSNTTLLEVLGDGKVGIGTDAPISKLEVSENFGTTAGVTKLRITARTQGAYDGDAHLEFAYNDWGNVNVPNLLASIQGLASVTAPTNVGGELAFATKALGGATATAPVERMRIDPAGKVGIGTNAPDSLLQIANANGSSYRFGYAGTSDVYFDADDVYFRSDNGGVNNMVLKGSKLGIGTTAPGAKLHVYGGNIRISSTDDKPQLEFFETAAARWVIGHSTAPNNYFAISEGSDVAASERLVIAPTTGSVGIGTTAPDGILHVANTTYIDAPTNTGNSSALIWRRLDKTIVGRIVSDTTNLRTQFWDNNSSVLTISNDKVGIGSENPAYKLDVRGDYIFVDEGKGIRFGGSSHQVTRETGNELRLKAANTTGFITFLTGGGTEYMRIAADGKVGIGNTNPAAPLTVTADSGANAFALRARSADDYSFIQFFNNAGSALRGQIYSKSTGDIGFTTGTDSSAGNDLYIKNGTGVGIGTTAPSVHLDVYASVGWGVVDIDGVSGGELRFQKAGTTWLDIYGNDSSYAVLKATSHLSIYVNSSTLAAYFKSDGNVGIGTDAPTTKLSVKSTGSNVDEISLVHSGNTVKLVSLGQESSHGSIYVRANSGVAQARISAVNSNYFLQNVGIGTTAPLCKLDIRTTSASLTDAGATVNIEEDTAWTQGLAFYLNNADVNNADYASACIGVANSGSNIIITSGARVVNNTNTTSAYKTLNSTTPAVYRQLNGAHVFYGDTGETVNTVYTPTERMRIDASGKVGIGTTAPVAQLMVSEAIPPGTQIGGSNTLKLAAVSSNAVGRRMEIGFDQFYGSTYSHSVIGQIVTSRTSFETGDLYFATKDGTTNVAPTERMRITSAGNVGIGTTAPSRPLSIYNNSLACLQLCNSTTGAATGDGFQMQLSGSTGYIYNYEAGDIIFGTSAATRLTISAAGVATFAGAVTVNGPLTGTTAKFSGDAQIGFTGGLNTWYSGITQLAIGANQSAVVGNSSYIGVQENSYLNASGLWKKVGAGGASNVWQDDGTIYLRTAVTGGSADDTISWNYPLTLSPTGAATFGGALTGTTATLAGTGLANAPTLAIDNSSSGTYVHSLEAYTANITSGQTNILVVGKEGNNKNCGYIGYKWNGDGSDANLLTLGHWGSNHLLTIAPTGAATFSGALTANSTIQVSRSSASPLFQVTDADAGGGAKSRWFGLVDGTSRFAIYGTNGSTEEFQLDGGTATFSTAVAVGNSYIYNNYIRSSNIRVTDNGYLGSQSVQSVIQIQGDGDVAIGYPTTINSSLKATTILDTNNSAGTNGQVLTTTGSGLDWKTLSEISGVDGSGTANYISKWTDSDTIGNSIVYNHAYGVVINATNLTSYASNRQVLEVRGTAGTGDFDGGITNLSASSDTNAHRVGQLAFINTANANHVNPNSTIGSRIAQIISTVVTSDSNAGDDSGGDLQFWTKPEAGVPAERMRIASGGNVGIGITAPSELLHVDGGGYFEGDVVRDGGWHRGLEITTQNASYASLYFGNQQTSKYSGIIWTSTTSGNTVSARGAQVYAQPTSAANTDLRFDTNNAVGTSSPTLKMIIRGDGKVGIGTTAPAYQLDVRGSGATTLQVKSANNSDDTQLKLQSNAFFFNITNQGAGGNITYVSDDAQDQIWYTDNASNSSVERFRIEGGADVDSVYFSNSHVGIGTTAPSAMLDVVTPASSTVYAAEITQSNTSNGDGLYVNIGSTSASDYVATFRSSNNNLFDIKGNGNVGIGTASPGQLLHVWKAGVLEPNFQSTTGRVGLQLNAGAAGDVGWILYSGYPAAGDFNIRQSGVANCLVIKKTTGYVGIGTDSPGSLLTISGNSDDGDNACALAINDEDSTGGSKLPAIMFYGGGTMQGRIRGGDATFSIAVGSSPSTALSINTTSRKLTLGSYGSGTHTGTAAYKLSVDSSGNVIETSIGSGAVDGSGSANYITKWTDGDTIGNSSIQDNGSAVVINDASGDVDFRVESNNDDYLLFTDGGADRMGVSTNAPLAKLHVDGDLRVGSASNGNWMGYKDVAMNGSSYTTALTINLANHRACHVKLFITGDWSSHSAVAFVGEYFVQNGGDGYQEPGLIISEFDNTNTDLIMSKIVDPSTDTFTIQLKLSTTANGSFTGSLSYHVMGMATAVS